MHLLVLVKYLVRQIQFQITRSNKWDGNVALKDTTKLMQRELLFIVEERLDCCVSCLAQIFSPLLLNPPTNLLASTVYLF